MNAQHNRFTPEEIEQRLANDPRPSPPLELLDRIRDEIPEQLDADAGAAGSGGSRPQTWLLAATLATVVFGGFLAWRLGEMNDWTPEPVEPSIQREATSDIAAVTVVSPGDAPGPATQTEGAQTTTTQTASAEAATFDTSGEIRSTDSGSRRALQDSTGDRAAESRGDEQERLEAEIDALRSDEVVAENQAAQAEEPSDVRLRKHDLYATAEEKTRSVAKSETVPGRLATPHPAAPPSTGGTHEPNDQPYGDMFFRSYGTNPFLDPEEDRLSTFGLDVDTGSYTLARSYLQRGHLPPAEAVRVEEFLNHFDYNDPAPRNGDFALTAEGAPSPFAQHENYYLLRFGIQGREIADRDRPPSTLIFVVDVSGSMDRENRLGLVKRSLAMLLDQLGDGDQVGLVVYGSRGQVLLQPTWDHSRIRRAIDGLRAGGSTNAEEGLVLAYDLAREFYRQGGNHRIILCSDGVANVGRTGPDSILERIGREAASGIELTTVGFGMGNYNDVLMEQLADQGDGRYAYVDDIKEARRLFVEELTGTLQTIASDAKAQVEFNPEAVERYRLIGYENRDIADERFRDDTVDAGEIGAGHHVTALYEIKLREGASRRRELATLRLRYHSKQAGQVIEEALPVRTRDLDRSLRSSAPSLRLAALVAEFGEILKGSYWAKDGDLGRVLRGVSELAGEASDLRVAEFRDLVQTAARLQEGEPDRSDWIDE